MCSTAANQIFTPNFGIYGHRNTYLVEGYLEKSLRPKLFRGLNFSVVSEERNTEQEVEPMR